MIKTLRVVDYLLTCLLLLTVVSALAKPAYAYADPGSGLFIVQVLTTTFAGVLFIVRRRLRRLRELITGAYSKPPRKD